MERKLFAEWAMDIAEDTKTRSTCLSRQVGVVVVKDKRIIATGYNGAPTGCLHCTEIGYCERKRRNIPSGQGLELCRAGHAESNALDQCARYGISCEGATMYVTTQPCVFCSIRIIQAGIKEIIFKGDYPTGLSTVLLKEANISIKKYEDALSEDRIKEEKKQKEMKKKIEIFNSSDKTF